MFPNMTLGLNIHKQINGTEPACRTSVGPAATSHPTGSTGCSPPASGGSCVVPAPKDSAGSSSAKILHAPGRVFPSPAGYLPRQMLHIWSAIVLLHFQ